MDSRISSLGEPEDVSFGPQQEDQYEDSLALEPLDDEDGSPDVVIAVEEVETDDGEMAYVRSAHAKRSDLKKGYSRSNQVLL
jgi:hypothetical protein